MDFNLCLREKYYEEIPEGYGRDWENGEKAEIIKLPGYFQAFKRPGKFFMGMDGELGIGNTKLLISINGNHMELNGDIGSERIYWNQRRITQSSFRIFRGDCLLIGKIKIIFYPDSLRIFGDEEEYSTSLMPLMQEELPYKGFPDYKRSPRLIKRVPVDKIEIKSPPGKITSKKGELAMLILPTLATSSVTVVVGMFMGRGGQLLLSILATGITLVVSVIRFLSDKKEQIETNKKNTERFEAYLLKKRSQIYALYKKEEEACRYHYPSLIKLNDMVHSFDSRIYERLATDQDFLTFSIGCKYGPVSFELRLPEKSITEEDPLYEEIIALKKEYGSIWKDVEIDLKQAHLGLVGDKKIIHQQLKIYLCQLVTFHSYHDLQIIAIYDSKHGGEFGWMKWLPHCKIQMLNVRGLIHTEKARDQILNSMNQILKERAQKLEESKKEARYRPHFLFVIDEPKLIMDHSIMEYLNGEGDKLGFSIIYTSYLRGNLPENIGTILMLEHAKEATLLLKEKVYCDEKIRLQRAEGINLELFSRDLGVLNHVLGATSRIPESITFFELFKVSAPEELQIEKRWKTHFADKSLAVPLGVRGEDDIVELNLHEKAHGPHGLVAGTTGSGKSEIIQSYILSLAANFHPHEVGFLLIDYKGGGMAGLFRELPHLLGTITNLDGSESMRALASIKSELARRQKLFGENNVNHINGYMGLFREGKVEEPIPHLFLISDEFAELKKEQPDFMKELVSTARIGRSLGVHLILATQKPTGVVDDQIWTNSKFKLALKVQNEGDSREILKTPDAAGITQAGRAYLQVGNNEIYELFQSAWSGAVYVRDKEKEVTLDNRVYLVNDLGQRMLVNQDLGGTKEEKAAKETQLDVTITHIREVYDRENAVPVKKPWLPALKPVMVSPHTEGNFTEEPDVDNMYIPLGVVDIPEEQNQTEYRFHLAEDGNLMYIASSGFGKSVLLTTAALGLSMRYPVSQLNLFVLDFGNNALIPLRRLPHTSEYITLDDTERYEKFKRLLTQEIKRRKKQMAEVYAQNFTVYNQTAEEPLAAWVILVDNFDAVREMGFDEEEYFTRASRDGVSLGINFIITATRNNAIRGATFNNFKTKIAGFNFESVEIMALVGRSPYKLPEIKGRALLKFGDRISIMQIYSMVHFTSDLEYRKGLNLLIDRIREQSGGQEAPHMPVMPEEVDISSIEAFKNPEIDLYVGLETEYVTLEGIRFTDSPLTILGNGGGGKTNLLKVFLHQLAGRAQVVIFDSAARELKGYDGKEGVRVIKTLEQFVAYMNDLEAEVLKREKEIEGKDPEMEEEIIRRMDPYAVIIDDLTAFFSRQTTAEAEIGGMFVRAAAVGILLIATNPLAKFYGSDAVTDFFKRSPNGVLVSPQGHMNAAPVELVPGEHEGVLYRKGKALVVRIPKA